VKANRRFAVLLALLAAGLVNVAGAQGRSAPKPRVVVTGDAELDDSNSLIRYLLYTTDFRTEGIVYSSSGVHWKGDGEGTMWYVAGREYTRYGNLCPCESWRWEPDDRFMDEALAAYEEAYPNLRVHDPDFPTPTELKSKLVWGNAEFEGDISEDTPGSDLIKRLLLDEDPSPVYLLAWGGQSTIGRALKSIEEQYQASPDWPAVRDRVSRKAIIQAWGDQDGVNAEYIRPRWPGVQFRQMSTGTWGYGARNSVLPENRVYLDAAWTKENVTSRGPLGAYYRVWGDNRFMYSTIFDPTDYFGFANLTDPQVRALGYFPFAAPQEPGSWISEGDTSTFMNLLDNGLCGYEDATWGGWGARQGVDTTAAGPNPQYASGRWFGAAQRDFAARLRWAVTPTFRGTNHEPQVSIRGARRLMARPGETIRLQGETSDRDGNRVSVRWWQYTDADTYPGRVALSTPEALTTSFQVPADATPGQTIHVILEATDNGSPTLTRYQRAIVTVGDGGGAATSQCM
jgi:hypothetical protein